MGIWTRQFDAFGLAQVVEAVGPVQTVALDQWISRGVGNRIAVMRLEEVAPDVAKKILTAAHRYDGLAYDIFFLDSRDQIYCSELVRLAFADGARIELGKKQKVRELDLDYGPVRKLIKSRWQKHPACINAGASTFEACFEIILNGELVTPESIARDARLAVVFSNFGVAWQK